MPADDIAIAGDFLLTYGSETFGMMVSIFPYDMNTANMAAGNSIDIEVKTVTFKEMSDIRVPYTPTPVTIMTDQARHLSAGALVVAAVAAALY